MHRYSSKAYLSDLFRRLGCDRRPGRTIAEPQGSSRLPDRLSNTHIQQLVTMHDRGVSNTEIATRFGISTYSVRLQLAQVGRGIQTSFSQEQIQTANELKRVGYSQQRIGRELGLSASSVRLLVAAVSGSPMYSRPE